MTDVAVGFSTATKQRLDGAPDVADRRLLHASALALGSVLVDVKRNYSGLRTASRPHLAWLLAQRVLGATAVFQTAQFLSGAALRGLHERSTLSIVRAEWTASVSAGLATAAGGGYFVRRMGGRPLLAIGFLVMPSLYVTLSAREHLVLCRHASPRSYEAGVIAATSLVPLLILPPSLRLLLGLPLALPPLCSAWSDEAAAVEADAHAEEERDDFMRTAQLLFAARAPPPAVSLLEKIVVVEAAVGPTEAVAEEVTAAIATENNTNKAVAVEAAAVVEEADEAAAAEEDESVAPSSPPLQPRMWSRAAERARLAHSRLRQWLTETHCDATCRAEQRSRMLISWIATTAKENGWLVAFNAGGCALDNTHVESSLPVIISVSSSFGDSGVALCDPAPTTEYIDAIHLLPQLETSAAAPPASSVSTAASEDPHATLLESLSTSLASPPAHLRSSSSLPLWLSASPLLDHIYRSSLTAIASSSSSQPSTDDTTAMNLLPTNGWSTSILPAVSPLPSSFSSPSSLLPAPPRWLVSWWKTFTYQIDIALDDGVDGRSFSSDRDDSSNTSTTEQQASGGGGRLTIESAPITFASLILQPSAYGGGIPLSTSATSEALRRLDGLHCVIAPMLAARTAPSPSIQKQTTGSSSPSTTDKTTPLAMRLGLLPEVAALDADGDIAEGLEPVFVNGIQTPFWQSHVRWFRWFASGDAALLLVLLLLKEIA